MNSFLACFLFPVIHKVAGEHNVVAQVPYRTHHVLEFQSGDYGGDAYPVAEVRVVLVYESALEVVGPAGVFVDKIVELVHFAHGETLLIAAHGDVYEYVAGALEFEVVEKRGAECAFHGIVDAAGLDAIASASGIAPARAQELVDYLGTHTDVLPTTPELEALDEALASYAIRTAVTRHAGRIEESYTMMGLAYAQTGKNLMNVERLVVTGGSLIHTKNTGKIASYALYDPKDPTSLKPRKAELLVDRKYILAAMGLLSKYYPEAALTIMKKELENDGLAE